MPWLRVIVPRRPRPWLLQFVLPISLVFGLLAVGAMTAGTSWKLTTATGTALWVGGMGMFVAQNAVLPPMPELIVQALFWYSIPSAFFFVVPFLVGRALFSAYRRARR